MKIRKLLSFGSALLLSLLFLTSLSSPVSALLEPTRTIDPNAVTRSLSTTDQVFAWTLTPKTAIPNLSGAGNIGGRVVLGSGSIGFALKQSSIVFRVVNNNHTGAYSGVDYQSVNASATTGGTGNLSTITYPFSLTTGTSYLITIDTGTAGWFTVKFKDGASAEVTVGQFKKYTDTQNVGNVAGSPIYTNIDAFDQAGTSCSAVANTVEADVAVSIDSVQQVLNAGPSLYTKCGSTLDKTLYNSTTKTATLKQLASNDPGAVMPHAISVGDSKVFITTSLDILTDPNTGKSVYKNLFSPVSNSNAQLYVQNAPNGNNDGDAYPIASGAFDLSGSDIDFGAQGVTLSTNSSTYVALAHNLNKVVKGGVFTLYVPYKAGDKAVGICPGAATVADITNKCNGLYYLTDKQTQNGVTATIVTVKDKQFWKVDGLSGTGAFSAATSGAAASAPNTGFNALTNSPLFALLITTSFAFALVIIAKRDKLPGYLTKTYSAVKKHTHILIAVSASVILGSGVIYYSGQKRVTAWTMPDNGSRLTVCREGNVLHGQLKKLASDPNIQIFAMGSPGNEKTVYVEGQTSIYLDAPAANGSIGFGDGLGHGAGGDYLLATTPDCLP